MSDIARVYKSGTEPWLYAGSARSDSLGAGTPEVSGKEKASNANSNLAVTEMPGKEKSK